MPLEPLSILAQGTAERAFAHEPFLRRLAKTAQLEPDAKVLQLSVGDGSMGLLLAQTLRCKVTVAVRDAKQGEALEQRARALSLGERLKTRELGAKGSLEVDNEFQAVLAMGPADGGFGQSAARARPYLTKEGRLCQLYVARVGFGVPAEAWTQVWTRRLGEAPPSPVELLHALEEAGFEPEAFETLTESELESGLRSARSPEEDEALLYAPPQSGPRATIAVAIGRRKELNEKLPASPDRG